MRKLLIGAGVLALSACTTVPSDPMANTFGNTLVLVTKDGIEAHTHFNADHTFNGVVPALGYHYQGTWAIDDKGQLCRTFNPPVPGRSNPDCDTNQPHSVGESWVMADGSKASLLAGIQ